MTQGTPGRENDPRELLESALEAARKAGKVLLDLFGQRLDVDFKTRPTDLVTDADRASEKAIADVLLARHPEHALLAEEGTTREGTTFRWVVDPLDGTVNFAHGIPHWCVSVAVEDDDGPVAGVIHDPLRGETFAATRGGGAKMLGPPAANGSAVPEADISVTGAGRLADALLATGFAYDPDRRAENLNYLDRLLLRIRGVRRMGSAALDLAWVASGRLDGYWEVGLNRWDLAAGVLLVREAGGRATGFDPGEDPLQSGRVVAGGPSVHIMCVSILAGRGS